MFQTVQAREADVAISKSYQSLVPLSIFVLVPTDAVERHVQRPSNARDSTGKRYRRRKNS